MKEQMVGDGEEGGIITRLTHEVLGRMGVEYYVAPCGQFRFGLEPEPGSLPLNGAGGLAGDVEHHPVNATHLTDDTARDSAKQLVG
jgi:hypothetical protein